MIGVVATTTLTIALAWIFFSGIRFQWIVEEKRVYDFKLVSEISVRPSPQAPWSDSIIDMDGNLNFRVFEADSRIIILGIQLTPLDYKENNSSEKAFLHLYSAPFLVYLKPSGEVLRYEFPNSIAPAEEKNLSQLWSNFLTIVEPRSSEWSLEEDQGEGKFQSAYRREKYEIHKSKLSYVDPGIAVEHHQARMIVSPERSWLDQAFIQEKLVYRENQTVISKISTHASLVFTDWDESQSIEIPKIFTYKDLADARSDFSHGEKSQITTAERVRLERIKQIISPTSWKQLLSDLQTDPNIENINAMRDYFLLYPQEIRKVDGLLLSSGMDDRTKSVLINVLELVGTPTAQEALVEIATNPRQNDMNRIRSVIAVSDVKLPTTQTVDSLETIYSTRNTNISKDLSNTAILGLGRIANKDILESTEISRRAVTIIKTGLEEPNMDSETKSATIRAVANTQNESLFVRASQYLDSPDPALRKSAISILDSPLAKDATSKLNALYNDEKEDHVRSEILRVQLERPGNTETFRSIQERFSTESNPENRVLMVEYLGRYKSLTDKSNHRLQNLLENETDPNVRMKIHQVLHSQKYK